MKHVHDLKTRASKAARRTPPRGWTDSSSRSVDLYDAADFNGDAFLDFFDCLDFVTVFETGC